MEATSRCSLSPCAWCSCSVGYPAPQVAANREHSSPPFLFCCLQYSSTLTVDEFGGGNIFWSSGRLLPEPFGQRNTTTTKLSWQETEDGLVLRAERLVGVMQVRSAVHAAHAAHAWAGERNAVGSTWWARALWSACLYALRCVCLAQRSSLRTGRQQLRRHALSHLPCSPERSTSLRLTLRTRSCLTRRTTLSAWRCWTGESSPRSFMSPGCSNCSGSLSICPEPGASLRRQFRLPAFTWNPRCAGSAVAACSRATSQKPSGRLQTTGLR